MSLKISFFLKLNIIKEYIIKYLEPITQLVQQFHLMNIIFFNNKTIRKISFDQNAGE